MLDVDDKDGKGTGPATMAAMEAALGPLPPTCRLTARGFDQPTGRFAYRIPDDLVIDQRMFKPFKPEGADGPAVDIVRTGLCGPAWPPATSAPRPARRLSATRRTARRSSCRTLTRRRSCPERSVAQLPRVRRQDPDRCTSTPAPAGELPDPLPVDVHALLDRDDDDFGRATPEATARRGTRLPTPW